MRRLGSAALIAAAIICAACSDNSAKKKPEPPPVPVATAQAEARDIPVSLRVVGRAEAFESVALKARIDGQVATVLFTEGQHVNQGDILLRLDPTDFSAKLQQSEATAARDEALLAKTRADTARYAALKARNFVSEEKLNDVRTNEAAASANLRAGKAAAEVARLQLSYTTIRAPITGIVGARLVFPGSAVKTNETTLATINRIRPLLVSFAISEKHLPQLRSAMQKNGMKVDVSPPANTSQHFEGQVRFIDNAVDTATGTILVKAELANDKEMLTAGQFLDVTLVLDTLKQAVTVPNAAVQQGAEGNFVFVVKNDNTVEVRQIETAASEAGLTAIRSGLQAGETVVTDGQLRLVPGAKIKTRETGAAGQQTKAAPAKTAAPPPAR